ncbi:hypothetical protein [Micromonospora echinofusca]|uniref:HprK-related kinase B n=1 Tax=Micromonospora echinofusca TaxID=47858 RepID=A0ABS3VQE7_MICEH|nr:hypothetical protein [Micromonospora echinofusca]MBO4206730.1 hypothetical protein [Micromonospora echinofusca]
MSGPTEVVAVTRSGAVRVSAPPDVLAELAGLVRPFVDLHPAAPAPADAGLPVTAPGPQSVTAVGSPPLTVAPVAVGSPSVADLPAVLVRDAPPTGPGWREEVLSSAYEPDRVLRVHDDDRVIAVVGGTGGWRTQQVLRSVRHLLRWQAYATGDLLLHGGLVTLGGRGVAFVGGKRSGKTSSILSALLRGHADFVSNDDVTVAEAVDGRLVGYGAPRTVNIRTDSLLALAGAYPDLAGLLTGASHPTNGFVGRHRTVEAVRTTTGATLPGSLWVRASEIAEVTGVALRPEAPVDALVLPGFDDTVDGPVLTRLDRATAAAALAGHIERQGTRYDPFLADWYPDTDAARRQRLVDRLLDEVPCYRLTQDMRRLAESTDLLLAELGARPV